MPLLQLPRRCHNLRQLLSLRVVSKCAPKECPENIYAALRQWSGTSVVIVVY